MKLHLGVVDLPYSHGDQGKSKTGRQRASTTGDVAEILESKYGVMQFFWDAHQNEVVDELSDSLQGAFESLLMRAPQPRDPLASAASKIEELFQRMIDSREMDNKVPGVPTAASLEGVSHRFKKKKSKNKQGVRDSRPSFYDTGLYQSSFKCWSE